MSVCVPVKREVVRPSTSEGEGLPNEQMFFRGMIGGMRCGVLSIDAGGRLVLLNEQARRILGLEDEPRRGTSVWRALPRYPQLVQALMASFRTTLLPNRAEMVLEDGSRAGRTIGFTVSLVRDDGGEPCGAAMFFKDLTPIERNAEQERLKDRLAALGQMATSLAHDIRNPLAAIEVNCKLLGRRLQDDAGCEELLTKIRAEVRRLNSSVDSCLQYVRPVSIHPAPAELVPLLEEAIAVVEKRRGRPGIAVRRRFAGDIPPFLMDRQLLRQVFENVILNAFEAVGESGGITVRTERIDAPEAASIPYRPTGATGDPWGDVRHFAVVRVSDTGPGIPEADRDRMFHPFFTTKPHGSGIGLAVAKKIVDTHRGLIEVTSAPGRGAEIVVHLPLVRRAAED